jgi:hypothetical protein
LGFSSDDIGQGRQAWSGSRCRCRARPPSPGRRGRKSLAWDHQGTTAPSEVDYRLGGLAGLVSRPQPLGARDCRVLFGRTRQDCGCRLRRLLCGRLRARTLLPRPKPFGPHRHPAGRPGALTWSPRDLSGAACCSRRRRAASTMACSLTPSASSTISLACSSTPRAVAYEKRHADTVENAMLIGRIAAGEVEDTRGAAPNRAKGGKAGRKD